MGCNEDECMSAMDVWVMWTLIICGVVFFVSLTATLIRCFKNRGKTTTTTHRPPPAPRSTTPVYYVSNVPVQTQQQYVTQQQYMVQVPQQQQYPQPPNYNQILGPPSAPPAYNVTYVDNYGNVQATTAY